MRSTEPVSKLFVAGLGDNRKSDLERVFRKYGAVLSVYVDDRKQFAFVEFSSASEAQQALEDVHQKKVNGSRLRVEYARSEKTSRDHRRSNSRERSSSSNPYHQNWQMGSGRYPSSMSSYRQGSYQQATHPSLLMNSSSMARGRSLTPPSLKQSSHLSSSMHHLRSDDFYPPYPPHFYMDPSAYYRPYDDPYVSSRFPPFFPSMVSSSSSRAYGDLYASANIDRRRRSRSQSRSRRRTTTTATAAPMTTMHRSRPSREQRTKRRLSSTPSPRERSPRTPSGSSRTRRRSRSPSSNADMTPEQKESSPTSSIDTDDKQSNGRSFQEKSSNQKHSKRRRGE